MNFRRLLPTLLCGVGLCCFSFARADVLETLEGARHEGRIAAISPSGELAGEGIPSGIKLEDLRLLTRNEKSESLPAKIVVETRGEGRLLLNSLNLQDERFKADLVGGEQLSLAIDDVVAVHFQPNAKNAVFQDALLKPTADLDRIFVTVEKQVETLHGLVTAINDSEVTFEVEGKSKSLPRERVFGIAPAQASASKGALTIVQLTDGSRLAGKVTPRPGNKLRLEIGTSSKVEIALDDVGAIDFRSPRLVYLSDLEPSAVAEAPILTLPAPWRRGRSVQGRTLTLRGGRTFAHGIGVHARSELTFELPGAFDSLLATIGLDAEMNGRGDCEFHVLGDGRSLWSQRMKGSDEPHELKLDIRGVKRLTLLVEPGDDFDFGDHADWCDVRVFQAKK